LTALWWKPRISCAWLALAFLAGCGGPETSTRDPAQPGPAIVDLTDPSQPLPPERFLAPDAAWVAPGDFLDLRVLGFPELSGTFLVAPDGRINLSLVGSVQAAGKSAEELDRDITTALAAYYRNLDVAVNVNARGERNVYVLGEVGRPGRYDFRTGERVLHALADAGGMTSKARETSIGLLRREADGKDHVYRLDFSHFHTMVAPKDIYLQPGDVVFVPKSRFNTVTDFATSLLDVVGRSALTALYIDDLARRTSNLTLAR
jgi:polysaccharide export outer membrane protein